MKRLIAIFFALGCSAFADINAVNGVAADTDSNINGVATPSAVNGQTLVSAGGALTLTYHTAATSGTDQTSYSFTSQAIGNAGDREYVIIAAIGRSTTNTGIGVSSLSVGGNSGTQIPNALSQFNDSGGSSIVVAFYYATVASGTTATVDVTFNNPCAGAAVQVYTIKDVASMTPFDFATVGAGTGTSASLNTDTPSGDSVVLGSVYVASTSDLTFTWSAGMGKDNDLFWDTARNASSAHGSFASAATQTVTSTWGFNNINVGVSVTLQ